MTLKQYLKERGIKQQAFAKKLEISDASMSRIIRGEQWPDKNLCRLIKKLTKGAVTAEDLADTEAV